MTDEKLKSDISKDKEAFIFFHALTLAAKDQLGNDDPKINEIIKSATMADLLPDSESKTVKTFAERESIIDKKYREVKSQLEAKADYLVYETDDNALAKKLLGTLEETYKKAKDQLLKEQIAESNRASEKYTENVEHLRDKRDMLNSKYEVIQSLYKKFDKQQREFEGVLYSGSVTQKFKEKKAQIKERENQIKIEIDANSWKTFNARTIGSEIERLEKLNNGISALLEESAKILEEEAEHQKQDLAKRAKDLKVLREAYTAERDRFDSTKKSLEKFARDLENLIQHAGDDRVIAELKDKQAKIQSEITQNDENFAQFPADLNDRPGANSILQITFSEIENKRLNELNDQILGKLKKENHQHFIEEQQSRINEIKAKKEKTVQEYNKARQEIISNGGLLDDFSRELQELVQSAGDIDVSELEDKVKEINDKIKEINAKAKQFPVESYDISEVRNEEKRVEIEKESEGLRKLDAEIVALLNTKEAFLEAQKSNIEQIKLKQQQEAISKKILDLEARKGQLESQGEKIANEITSNLQQLNPAVSQAEKAIDNLVSLAEARIKENSKTSAEKIPLLGFIFHAIAESIFGDERKKDRKQQLQNSGVGQLADEMKKAIENNTGVTTDHQDKITQLASKLKIDNKSINDINAKFKQVNAALDDRRALLESKNENVEQKNKVNQNLLEAKQEQAALTKQPEILTSQVGLKMANG